MDSFTLVVASGLASLIMAATMFLLYRASPRHACLLDWSVAGICFLASNGVAFFASTYSLSHFLIPAIANALYVAGHYMIAAGVRRHVGLRPRFDLLAILVAAVLLLHLAPFTQSSVTNRVLLLTPLIAAINFSVVWLLWRLPDSDAKPAYFPLMILELVFMVQLVLRAILIAVSQETTLTFMGSQLLQTSGSVFVLAFLSLALMSCALIVIRHQELDLRRASYTDSLTGWFNRRALHDIAEREFRRGMRTKTQPSFITFDIDHFKSINDRYGHTIGDAAIKHVTAVSALALRGYDALFRIGGEEFAVITVGHAMPETRTIGERLRDLIEKTPLVINDRAIPITVSVGVAAFEAADLTWKDALQRADNALYHAKNNGRNRLSVHGEDLARRAGPALGQIRDETVHKSFG